MTSELEVSLRRRRKAEEDEEEEEDIQVPWGRRFRTLGGRGARSGHVDERGG
jgi:hypothetical protein